MVPYHIPEATIAMVDWKSPEGLKLASGMLLYGSRDDVLTEPYSLLDITVNLNHVFSGIFLYVVYLNQHLRVKESRL